MVYLPGGPSHLDMYDLKPDAPIEVRGEFRPIRTAVPGIQVCEHLPQLARIMDHLAPIRTIVGGPDDHACHMCLTGWSRQGPQPLGGWPTFGSFVAKLQGAVDPTMPPYVGLAARMIHPPYNDPGPGFLGARACGVHSRRPVPGEYDAQRGQRSPACRPDVAVGSVRAVARRGRRRPTDRRPGRLSASGAASDHFVEAARRPGRLARGPRGARALRIGRFQPGRRIQRGAEAD